MTTETQSSLQTGVTPNPISSNAQDFSGSDDEIMDNFAEAPIPDDANRSDDGTPMGLGGEKEKQSEPASSTLEADIVNGTTKQSGDDIPSGASAGKSESVQDASEKEGSDDIPVPDSEEPDTPEFPPALLQMAGLTDAAAAQEAGFQNPEALFAAVQWQNKQLAPGKQPDHSSEQGLYKRPVQTPATPKALPQETNAEPEGESQPFELPADKMEMLDEDLQDVIRQMNGHYQQQVDSLQSKLTAQQENLGAQQDQDEEMQFDEAVKGLGEDWKDTFGDGDGRELVQAGQHDPAAMTKFNHRALLFESVQAVRDVNAKQGNKPMDLDQEVQWALMQRYPNKFQEIISGNSNGKPARTRGVTASRPTQRNTPPKGHNAKVLADVNSMLHKRKGYSLDMGQEEEFDGDI